MFHKDDASSPSPSSPKLRTTKENEDMRKMRRRMISLLLYFLMCIGVAFQISGANWDIVWHGVRNVESLITPSPMLQFIVVLH